MLTGSTNVNEDVQGFLMRVGSWQADNWSSVPAVLLRGYKKMNEICKTSFFQSPSPPFKAS